MLELDYRGAFDILVADNASTDQTRDVVAAFQNKQVPVHYLYVPALGRHFMVVVSPLFGVDGKLQGSVHYARDITEKKKLGEILIKEMGISGKDIAHALRSQKKPLPVKEQIKVDHERLDVLVDRIGELVIAVSEFTAGQVRDLLGVPADRVRVIPHGASTHSARTNAAPPAREQMILHVGAIQRRKNLLRLIEAFERTEPGWRLALAGSCGYGSEEILHRIEASSRRQDVRILGYVSGAQLDDLYARAAVFAFPSLDEGFGMPILDAMAAGVPVRDVEA